MRTQVWAQIGPAESTSKPQSLPTSSTHHLGLWSEQQWPKHALLRNLGSWECTPPEPSVPNQKSSQTMSGSKKHPVATIGASATGGARVQCLGINPPSHGTALFRNPRAPVWRKSQFRFTVGTTNMLRVTSVLQRPLPQHMRQCMILMLELTKKTQVKSKVNTKFFGHSGGPKKNWKAES